MRHALIAILMLAFVALSCVQKLDVNSFPEVPPTNQERIEYIPILPEWQGFNSPEDVHVGYDELIYVADTQNDRVVMLDLNGTVLGYSQRIETPVAIAQDRKLDLLVVGRKDCIRHRHKAKDCMKIKKNVALFHPIMILIATTQLVYLNSLSNHFTYDDEFTIVNNYFIKTWTNVSSLLNKEYFTLSGELSYRPVVTLSYSSITLYGN